MKQKCLQAQDKCLHKVKLILFTSYRLQQLIILLVLRAFHQLKKRVMVLRTLIIKLHILVHIIKYKQPIL